MVLIGSISFLELYRSSKICAPPHKLILWNIFDTIESVLWNILDIPPPFDFQRKSNVHSISNTSCSFLIWSFTFTAAIAAAFCQGRHRLRPVDSHLLLLTFSCRIITPVDTGVE